MAPPKRECLYGRRLRFANIDIGHASSIRFTPDALAENSNILKQISEPACSNIFLKFAEIINHFGETYIESQIGTQQDEFVRLGLADSVLLLLSYDPSLILVTANLGLYLAATNRGLKVENFNHQKEANSS